MKRLILLLSLFAWCAFCDVEERNAEQLKGLSVLIPLNDCSGEEEEASGSCAAPRKVYDLSPHTRLVLKPSSVSIVVPGSSAVLFSSSSSFLAISQLSFSVLEKDGNFNITKTAPSFTTSHQTITVVHHSVESGVVTVNGALYLQETDLTSSIPYSCSFLEAAPFHVSYSCSVSVQRLGSEPSAAFEVSFVQDANAGEKFTGFGIQFSQVDFTGAMNVPLFVTEQGVGRSEEPVTSIMNEHFHGAGGTKFSTYAPSPLWVSSHNRSSYLLNTEYATFSHSHQALTFSVVATTISGGFLVAPTFYGIVEKVTADVTGRFNGVPEWAYSNGAIVGMQGGEEKVEEKLRKLQEGGVKIAGLWIQDWAGKRIDSFGSRVLWNWELDDKFYPNWEKFLHRLSKNSIRVLAYINPCVSTRVDEFKPHARRNLFEEAKSYGFLITKTGEPDQPYVQSSASDEFQFGTVDLTNPTAVNWYQDVIIRCNLLCDCDKANNDWPTIKSAEDLPSNPPQCGNGGNAKISHGGWMADFGEYLPFDTTMHDGTPGSTMHSLFPPTWAQVNSETIGADGDQLFFSRSGGLKSPGKAKNGGMFWVGDQNTAWDGNDGL